MVYFLPDELWVKIINLLYIKDAISTAMVNKRFFNLTKHYNTIRYQKLDTISNLDIVKTDTFIKHLYRVKYFEDLNLGCKMHLYEYRNKLSNLEGLGTRCCASNTIGVFNNFLFNPNLKYLYLDSYIFITIDKYFDDFFDTILAPMNKLRELNLRNSIIKDNQLEIMMNLNLENLHITNCQMISDLSYIPKNIKGITISRNNILTSETLLNFFKTHPCLNEIKLSLIKININIILEISKYREKLTLLEISYPNGVFNNLSLFIIANNCHNLSELNLNNTEIDDEAIQCLIKNCPKITKLSVGSTDITDISLMRISVYYPRIKYLDVHYNNISYLGVNSIVHNCKDIYYLNIVSFVFTQEYIISINRIIREKNKLIFN